MSKNLFQSRIYADSRGNKLPYRLIVPPSDDSKEKHPVLLFLHGSGERGHDNKAQLKNVAAMFGQPQFQRRYPCLVVVPQCPEGEGWSDFSRNKAPRVRPARAMRLALEIVENLPKEFSVDASRLYIAGISMGGFGVWDCLTRFPKLFAAGIVCCGGGRPRAVTKSAAKVPVWAFHSADDNAVPIAMGREMVAACRKKGGTPRYTEYEAVGHNCWDVAFADRKLLPWLFAQRLR